jgi:hypothetical protein
MPLEIYASQKLWRTQVVARLGAGVAVLSISATTGFAYIPTCNGVPTGTPETQAGLTALVADVTDYRLYFWAGGAWRNAGP